MSLQHFLWPKPNLSRCLLNSVNFLPISHVEDKLFSMFPHGYPVLFSSARSALVITLSALGYSRNDHIGLFPYASHCVLDAVSRVATPSTLSLQNTANIIYHQWGYFQFRSLKYNPIIEDSVDTLVRPKSNLFIANSKFEIWSLPKILATTGGGVLWCRSENIARKIRNHRNGIFNSSLLWIMRLFGYKSKFINLLWHSSESVHGRPSRLQTSEIYFGLSEWDELIRDREEKLKIAWKLAPSWLRLNWDRLPCVIPVELKENININQLCSDLKISTGFQHFTYYDEEYNVELKTVLPIPIHQDLSISEYHTIVNKLTPFVRDDFD